MTIKVVNKFKVFDHVYCGRGTPLGNPFPIGPAQDRDTVCDMYEKWFYEHVDEVNFLDLYEHISNGNSYIATPVTSQTSMLLDLFGRSLFDDLNLGCFCAPKRCHCDTIKHFLDLKEEELLK